MKINDCPPDLQLGCDCSEEEPFFLITTNDGPEEIAICMNCGTIKYTDSIEPGWIDSDGKTFEELFPHAPKEVTEHHNQKLNEIQREIALNARPTK